MHSSKGHSRYLQDGVKTESRPDIEIYKKTSGLAVESQSLEKMKVVLAIVLFVTLGNSFYYFLLADDIFS